jgi:hypothetical protein
MGQCRVRRGIHVERLVRTFSVELVDGGIEAVLLLQGC